MTAVRISLSRLKELASRATPGPWECDKWGDGSSGDVSANVLAPSSESVLCHDIMDFDAAYIAAASPDTVLALVEAVERMRFALARAALAEWTVTSQSTGVVQRGPTDTALVAREALAWLEGRVE